VNANGKREAPDAWSNWRGERRSTRLGAPPDIQLDEQPSKRARTEESSISTSSADAAINSVYRIGNNSAKLKSNGAAAVKSTETAVEQVAGKKKSKFWFYAVEPVPGAVPSLQSGSLSNDIASACEGKGNADGSLNGRNSFSSQSLDRATSFDRSLEGSLSPAPSLDS
jgi:hypothetical protein